MTDKNTQLNAKVFRDAIPLAEWIVAACGGILIAASFGFLGYRAIIQQKPPSFDVVVEKVEAAGMQASSTVAVHNRGGRPAADVTVHASSDNGRQLEVVIDYVPVGSSRRVVFLFASSVEASDAAFTVDSYSEP